MKLPLTWLKEFVPVKAGAEEIARRLTMAGFEVEEIATVEGEPVLEVAVTPNRGDCLSILGMAREVGAIWGIPIRLPKRQRTPKGKGRSPISVRVTAEKKCPRYSLAVIPAIKVGPSPDWMVRRLSQVGIRSINNIVDVTNYVLMELGQPLHAFDLKKIEGGKILVRRASAGEKLLTLDGEERGLEPDDLVIADGEGPIALAGVMGGKNSEIDDSTEDVAIESACFEPTGIRRTSHRLGLQSESSYRFERGVDPEGVIRALERAVQLIGGATGAFYQDLYKYREPARPLSFSPSEVGSYLGGEWSPTVIRRRLEGLSFRIKTVKSDRWQVTVPGYRRDIAGPADLIEEVVRLEGLGKVPVSFPPLVTAPAGGSTALLEGRRLKRLLSDSGFHEVIHFSFLSPKDLLNPSQLEKAVLLQNPLGEDLSVLRTSLLPSLLKTAAFHHSHKIFPLRLFEFRNCFEKGEEGIIERKRLAALITGAGPSGSDFLELKGVLEGICRNFRLSFRFERSTFPFLHPGKQANLRAGFDSATDAGVIGEIHPDLQARFGLKRNAVVFEVDWDLFLSYHQKVEKRSYEGYSLQPVVERDLALVVDEGVAAGSILDFIREQDSSISDVEIFDLYRGEQIREGKKGLAFAIRMKAPKSEDRTLTDEEVGKIFGRVVEATKGRFGATVR